ncbi:MAG: GspL/Epsl periplasmic domain-containing protein [Chloroflexota bacterium]
MKRVCFIDIAATPPDAFREGSLLQDADGAHVPFAVYELRSTAQGYAVERSVPDTREWRMDHGAECYLSIPLSWLDFRVLTLPIGDPDKLRDVIPFELDSLVLGGAQSVVFDIAAIASSGEGSFDVLVAYLKKDLFHSLLDVMAARGVDPRVVTSLDLRAALRNGAGTLAERVLQSPQLDEPLRMEAALADLSSPVINLRRSDFVYRKDTRRLAKSLKVSACLLIALASVLHLYLGAEIFLERKGASAANRAQQQTYASLFPNQKKITDEVYQLRAQVKALKEKAESLTGVDTLGLLLALSKKNPKGVQVNELTVMKDALTIKAEAPSLAESERLKSALSESLVSVTVTDVKPHPDGRTMFTLNARGVR